MDEIYEAEHTSGQVDSQDLGLSGKSAKKPPLSRTKTRKDSFGTVAGLTGHLSDFLHEYGGGGDINNRLEALEEATKRMEALLIKLGQDLGDDGSESDPDISRAVKGHINAEGEDF